MKEIAILLMLATGCFADSCRALVDGAGCRTRQLAMQRIWEKLPLVTEVKILPREDAPKANQRYFIIHSDGPSPSRDDLIKALGRRAKHYIVLSVEAESRFDQSE
ncbi:hypothetical protein [Haloferula sp.]|uniref:hypothetical protein n=1 Tax=Haloferula sp. TaxID=2497595 RepID=UPI003C7307DB